MDASETAGLLDEVAESQADPALVGHELGKLVEHRVEATFGACLWAFGYVFVASDDTERRQEHGPYAPWVNTGTVVDPLPLSAVPTDVQERWLEVAGFVTHPVPRARLFDLLWLTRFGDEPFRHAQVAIDAHLDAAANHLDGIRQTEFLGRALELSNEINDSSRLSETTQAIESFAALELDGDFRSRPGVVLRLLEQLADLRDASQQEGLHRLVDRASEGLADNPWVGEAAIQLQEKLARNDPERLAELRRNKVSRWLDYALTQDGLARLLALSRALELARNTRGATDLADEIRHLIQETDPESITPRRVAVHAELPVEEFEQLVEWIAESEGVGQALTRFGGWGPPSGDPADSLRLMDELREQFPLQFLFTRVMSDRFGRPTRFLYTDEEKRQADLVRHEVLRIEVHARFLADALERIWERFDEPSEEDLAELLTTDLISAGVATSLARAFRHFWTGDPEAAATVALPKIEAILRGMLVQIGGVVYREPVGQQAGGVRMFGQILSDLEGHVDEGWRRYLSTLLVDPLGLNLRNLISHGLIDHVQREDAALVLHAVCFLRLLKPSAPEP